MNESLDPMAALAEILNPKALIHTSLNPSTKLKQILVKEAAPESNIKTLKIKKIPDEFLAFTLDLSLNKTDLHKICFQQLSLYLNKSNSRGLNKSCDLVIFYKIMHWEIALIELKSNDLNFEDVERQLDNSKIYVDYL